MSGLQGQTEDQRAVAAAEEDVEGKERRSGQRVAGAPGEIDDGWGELLESLENFPYEHYGIKVIQK